jgi:pimeloyl-ACP methyl ester carboxylesterase
MSVADRFFYYPTRVRYDDPREHGLVFEPVHFLSGGDARLHGWFFPGLQRVRGTVVHAHGNAGNISAHFPYAAWLSRYGWNVLCFDYRGYGRSEGRPTRAGTRADVQAAIAYAQTRAEVDPARIVLFGQSIGGTLGLVAAAGRSDLCGLVIDGAFAGYRREARELLRRSWLWGVAGPVSRYLVSDEDSPIATVAQLPRVPKLFICGTADRIVKAQHTIDLHAAAPEPKQLHVIDGGGHCDWALADSDDDRALVAAFLEECATSGPPFPRP